MKGYNYYLTLEILCTKEACAMIGVTRMALHNYVSKGLIKKHKGKNTRPFYRASEIDKWLSS